MMMMRSRNIEEDGGGVWLGSWSTRNKEWEEIYISIDKQVFG